jgi:tetratricopeptide (TPR) repeat protein
MSFFMMEDYDRAAVHFKHVLTLDPEYHKAAFMMGVTEMANLHMSDAKPYLEETLRQQPNNPFYLLQYGLLLSLLGDAQAGLHEAQRASALIPSYAPVHFHLGRLYSQLGDYEHARLELETAVRLSPDDLPEAYYQLGEVYRRLGDQEKSGQAFQKFQQLKAQRKIQFQPPPDTIIPPIVP